MVEHVIDPEEWEIFKSMADPATLVELLNAYLGDSPQLIDQMRTGLATGDIELVRRAAHTLKSNSASFGGSRLAYASRELEMIAKSGTLEGADPKLVEIEAEYAKLSALLVESKNEF
jgi:HPt (histidine-containing phosphotransfer) domain-containing protein